MRKLVAWLLSMCLVAATPLPGQSPGVTEMYDRIRAEETSNSQIMRIIHEITDVHGHRVTGSPQLKAASEWAMKTLTSFGLTNAHLEPYTFQPPSAAKPVGGWENIELAADAVKPFRGPLMVKPLAWTPSTKGVVTANVVMITPPGLARPGGGGGVPGFGGGAATSPEAAPHAPAMPPPMPARQPAARPEQPTREELDAYLHAQKDKVRGRIVLVGKPVEVPTNLTPAPLRRSNEQWRAQFDANNPAAGRFGGGRGVQQPQAPEGRMSPQQVARAVDQFLLDTGALVRINDAGRAYGLIVAQQNSTYDSSRVIPTLVMRNEDYGRIGRLLADGIPVTLRVNIQNREYPETTAHNVLAEIPGTDKAEEVVMLGGHFDSWHGATGATDNGIGCAMMMEAVRILAALKVKPRRTIRIALWSGEEQGLLGSLAYVQQHFGTAENPKPEHARLSAYFNIDSGTSKPRGASVFGPARAADMLRAALLPYYAEWGFVGVRATNSRAIGGTDSTSFNNAGLPGVGLSQDPFDYNTFTHHTNYDTYERIYEEDVREGAVMIASLVYAAAMADEMVPRFASAEMPAPVAVPGPGSAAVPAPVKAAPAKAPRKGQAPRKAA
jgi:hypothetical protein